MIVDMHVHVWDEGYQPPGYKLGMAKSAAYRTLPHRDPLAILPRVMEGASDPDGTLLLDEMNRAGVDAVVAMTVDLGLAFGQDQDTPPSAVIEHHGELILKYPGRFFAFFGMDPRRDETLEYFRRAVDEWGFKGLKLYPACGYSVADDICQPLIETCVERGLPVLVHTAHVPPPLRAALTRPSAVSELAARYPEATLIYGHAGYRYWWEEALQVSRSHPTSYIEISQWTGEALRNPELFVTVLSEMRDVLGAHRILLGTDFAAGPRTVAGGTYPEIITFMRELPERADRYGRAFTRDEADLILGGNAARLLGLDTEVRSAETS